MEIETTLRQIGLKENEASIYIACLQLGKDTAYNIAQRTSMKRSTVYLTLNHLNIRGLITISRTPKATLYEAVTPRKLLYENDFRRKQLESVLPFLMTLHKEENKPKIQTLEGEKALNFIYDETLKYLKKGEENVSFGSVANGKTTHKDAVENWIKIMKNKKYSSREILNDEPFEREYIKRIKANNNPNHKIRIVPKGTFSNDNIMYGNKLAIFSTQKDFFVTVIESNQISKSYRNIFELLWKSAKEV